MPNILIIHCHDLGTYTGAYSGNSASTPALDKMAHEGIVLESHFSAAPTCSPSRASMFSGLNPHRHGLMGLQNGGIWNLDPSIPLIPTILGKNGFETCAFGVWHVNIDPSDFGVDIYDPVELPMSRHSCEVTSDRFIEYLDQRDETKPFFAAVGFFEPHRDFTDQWENLPDPETVEVPHYLPDIPETRDELRLMYGDISRADAATGRIISELDKRGLSEDTMVIFTVDHGIAMPYAKGTLYDPGIHIAAIFRWPGKFAADKRIGTLTSNVDLLPTILSCAGLKEQIPPDIDGIDLMPALEGSPYQERNEVFTELTWHDFYEPMRAIRTQKFKLIRNFEVRDGLQLAGDIQQAPMVPHIRWQMRAEVRPEYELYDLEEDPREQQNLSEDLEYISIFDELKSRLNEYLVETNDPILNGPVEPPETYYKFVAKSSAGLP